MRRSLRLIMLALILLMTCSGCFFSERGGGGYDDHDRGEHSDHDRSGHEEQH